MTKEDLYTAIIKQIPISEIHPLHKAMMEECCEAAINNQNNITDEATLIFAAQTAFVTSNELLKSVVKAGLNLADQVTLNYAGQSFVIPQTSKFFNEFSKI